MGSEGVNQPVNYQDRKAICFLKPNIDPVVFRQPHTHTHTNRAQGLDSRIHYFNPRRCVSGGFGRGLDLFD